MLQWLRMCLQTLKPEGQPTQRPNYLSLRRLIFIIIKLRKIYAAQYLATNKFLINVIFNYYHQAYPHRCPKNSLNTKLSQAKFIIFPKYLINVCESYRDSITQSPFKTNYVTLIHTLFCFSFSLISHICLVDTFCCSTSVVTH